MTWAKGRERILEMLSGARPDLERIEPNPDHAERLLNEAETHIRSCETIIEFDPPGAFQLAYDAARKACEGLLAVQGLRSTREGGHIVVADAVREQFNGPRGVAIFADLHRLRRQRAESQYPRSDTPPVTFDDADELTRTARAVVDAARTLLNSDKLSPFDD